MAGHTPPDRQIPPVRWLRWVEWFFAGAILLVTAFFGIYLWHQVKQDRIGQLHLSAAAIAAATRSYYNEQSLSLHYLSAQLEAAGGFRRSEAARNLLSRFHTRHPELFSVSLLAPDGRIIATAGAPAGLPLSRLQVHPALQSAWARCLQAERFCVSAPIPDSSPVPQWFISFVLPVAVQNQPSRVLMAQLLLARQELAWRNLPLEKGIAIFVLREDGFLEGRYPAPTQLGYAHRQRGAAIRYLEAHPGLSEGSYAGYVTAVGQWRLGAFHRVSDFPMVAGVSVDRSILWAAWRRAMLAPLVFVCALLLLSAAGSRRLRRHVGALEAKRQSAEQDTRLARASAERLRDFYAALSELNQFIVRHPEPDQLFAEVCRIAVSHAQLRLAWLAVAHPEDDSLRIVAHAAAEPLGVDLKRVALSTRPDLPEGRGASGRAFRSQKTQIINDLFRDQDLAPWWSLFRAAGVRSGAAFPVLCHDRVAAVMAVHSEKQDFFTPDIASLLEEIAADIGFSLEDYERNRQREHQALHDALTELPNRTLFRDRLGQAVAKAERDERLLAVAILDLDGFKAINDRLGHPAGDSVLRQVAQRLSHELRASDTVARLGGDEFGLILSGLAHVTEAVSLLERAREALAEPFRLIDGEAVKIGASIGITVLPWDEGKADDLLRHADLALYRAKEGGKNCCVFFSQDMEEKLLQTHRIREDFLAALERRELVPYYQPQVQMHTGEVLALEALIRWPQPDGALRETGAFMPVVEADQGLIRALGRFVLDEALAQMKRWAQGGLALPIAVNIGADHLLATEFLDDLDAALSACPNSASRLIIEITETAYLADLERASRVLAACRNRGVRTSLDDFGTGHASLSYLQQLPVDEIKLDQSFLRNLLSNDKDIAIVVGLITGAQLLELEVMAEGVETVELGTLLLAAGCPRAQGYAIAPAMPAQAIPGWVSAWRPASQWREWGARAWIPSHLKLLAAALMHRQQAQALLAVVQDPQLPLPEQPAAGLWDPAGYKRCPLGRWHETQRGPEYGDDPAFSDVGAIHREVHALGGEITRRLKAGDREVIRPLAEKLRKRSDALLDKLWKLLTSSPT